MKPLNNTINLIPVTPAGTLPPGRRPRYYALIRVSTEDQDVTRQRREITRLAAKQGIDIIKWISLPGISGKDTLRHEDVKFLLAEMANPECDGLLVSEQSRLFRPTRPDHMSIGQVFQDFRKPIWSASEGEGIIELWTREGFNKFMDFAKASFDEREKIKQRTNKGKENMINDAIECAKIGGMTPVMGSQTPYGYTLVYRDRINDIPAHWIVNIEEAAILVQMFTWAREGVLCHTIASMLNAQGTLTKRAGKIDRKARDGKDGRTKCAERINDGKWTKQSVYQMLTKPHYTGTYLAYAGTEFETVCKCPVIIDRELFEVVQMILSDNKRTHGGPSGAENEWLLTRMGWCLFCGHRLMVHRSSNGKHGYYTCSHRSKPPVHSLCTGPLPHIRQSVLEPCVFDAVWEAVTTGDTLVNLINEACAEAVADPLAVAEVGRLESLLIELRLDEDRAYTNLNDRDIPRERSKPVFKEAEAKVKSTEFRLAQARVAAEPRVGNCHNEADVRALAAMLKAAKPQTFAERREWLLGIVESFRTDGRRVEIELNIPQAALGDAVERAAFGSTSDPLFIGKRTQHSAIRLTEGISFILKATISA